jgi:hypothetical protein
MTYTDNIRLIPQSDYIKQPISTHIKFLNSYIDNIQLMAYNYIYIHLLQYVQQILKMQCPNNITKRHQRYPLPQIKRKSWNGLHKLHLFHEFCNAVYTLIQSIDLVQWRISVVSAIGQVQVATCKLHTLNTFPTLMTRLFIFIHSLFNNAFSVT